MLESVQSVIVPSALQTGAVPAVHAGKQVSENAVVVLLKSAQVAVATPFAQAATTRSGKYCARHADCVRASPHSPMSF